MVQINFAQKTVNAKIVYYGPGMSGKTTNLEVVHQRAPSQNRGELTSISTDGDRTLFFDYMPLDLGMVAGMRTAFQVYTVPGQVYYNSTRKLVLQGVDGVVFVADSSSSMLEQNLESLRNLEENLAEYGKSLETMPHVIQYNKRDLPDAMPVADLDRHLNAHGVPTFEAVASSGQGVFPTLKALAASVLKNLMQESTASRSHAPGSRPAAPARGAPARTAPPSAPVQQSPPAPVAPVHHPPSMQPVPIAAQAPVQPQVQPPRPGAGVGSPVPPAHHQPVQPSSPGYELQTAAPPPPAVSPRSVMQSPAPSPARRQAAAARAHSVPSPRTSTRQAGARRRQAELAVPRKGNGLFTAVFFAMATGIGALLAWVILKVL